MSFISKFSPVKVLGAFNAAAKAVCRSKISVIMATLMASQGATGAFAADYGGKKKIVPEATPITVQVNNRVNDAFVVTQSRSEAFMDGVWKGALLGGVAGLTVGGMATTKTTAQKGYAEYAICPPCGDKKHVGGDSKTTTKTAISGKNMAVGAAVGATTGAVLGGAVVASGVSDLNPWRSPSGHFEFFDAVKDTVWGFAIGAASGVVTSKVVKGKDRHTWDNDEIVTDYRGSKPVRTVKHSHYATTRDREVNPGVAALSGGLSAVAAQWTGLPIVVEVLERNNKINGAYVGMRFQF